MLLNKVITTVYSAIKKPIKVVYRAITKYNVKRLSKRFRYKTKCLNRLYEKYHASSTKYNRRQSNRGTREKNDHEKAQDTIHARLDVKLMTVQGEVDRLAWKLRGRSVLNRWKRRELKRQSVATRNV